MLDDDVRALAAARSLGIFTTLMPGGQPQTSAVWPHSDERHILVGTNTSRQKYRNVVGDPRVTILLLDPENSRRYIEVRGRIVDVERGEAALALARTTFTKWTGKPEIRPAEGDRVLLRMQADHIHRKE
ncbi:TIGR03618 family F420-dependent PPOX class oxidoreductase [Amycolatopsis sp. WQ 127309]|uniref:TIGR03618 family F420-dependent PPOX class oxidoreductase n=1 Tax=Amycolatopsis sp. WQ 127309 TaxID=2932773 RepID=UPI001FF370B2|nr:TIGR03618 family F420-dependent PPOX class oxidoreductase [Amycolatopsis sp. WQ 127309]UOZ03371.1 TIGR03618 family F420-dependent PPOX class oxidoreductase [Amycolatopsis sp. WQ 127309]